MADQVTLTDAVIAQPIRQFRSEAVEISDPESESQEKESEDPEIVALFDKGFFQLPTQVRRQKIKEFRKAICASLVGHKKKEEMILRKICLLGVQ